MIIKEIGKRYTLQTAQGMDVIDIVFAHKVDGKFVDGITNEELINILEHRVKQLVKTHMTTENLNTLTHIQQAKSWMNARNYQKLKTRKDKKYDDSGHGIQFQTESRQAG